MEPTEKIFFSIFIQVLYNNEVTNNKENLFNIGPEVPLLIYEKQTYQTNINQYFIFDTDFSSNESETTTLELTVGQTFHT